MTVNIDLLDKTLSHIEDLDAFQREGLDLDMRWNQNHWGIVADGTGTWRCGTSLCFAGWACQLAGDQLVPDGKPVAGTQRLCVENPDGTRGQISDRAQELLGLNEYERTLLFGCPNDIDGLRRTVAGIKAGAHR